MCSNDMTRLLSRENMMCSYCYSVEVYHVYDTLWPSEAEVRVFYFLPGQIKGSLIRSKLIGTINLLHKMSSTSMVYKS